MTCEVDVNHVEILGYNGMSRMGLGHSREHGTCISPPSFAVDIVDEHQ